MAEIQAKPATQFLNVNVLDTLFVKGVIATTDATVVIRQASQLAGVLDSTKRYVIDGVIDMGTQSITVPTGGLFIAGLGFGISSLESTESNYTMFVTTSGSFSGDLFLNGCDFSVTGTSSKIFDVDNDENSNAIEFVDCNFVGCTSLGNIKDYRQLLTSNVAFIATEDGLTFDGTWSGGAAILQTILIGIGAGVTMFKEGTSLTFAGSVRSDMNALLINATTVLFDFVEGNILADGGFDLADVRVNPAATGAIPNIPATSEKARFRNNVGIANTFVGSAYTFTTAVSTGALTVDTLVKMPGATTYTDEFWFSNSTNNAAIYDSSLPTEIEVDFNLSFSGGNNDEMVVQVRQFDDSASAFVDIGPEFTATLNGGPSGSRAEGISGFVYTSIAENDRIEIWIKNISDGTAITPIVGGSVIIKERAS